MMALSQVRCDPRARAYVDKHRAAGKSYRDAVRCLKRRLSDVVWRQMRADLALADLTPSDRTVTRITSALEI